MAGQKSYNTYNYGLEHDSTFISGSSGGSADMPVQKERQADVTFLPDDGRSGDRP